MELKDMIQNLIDIVESQQLDGYSRETLNNVIAALKDKEER